MNNLTEEDLLRILARSWNNLKVSLLEDILDTHIIYQSQWVKNPIVGKKEVFNHLTSKYAEIQKYLQFQKMVIIAEMAYFPRLENKPCLIITQKSLKFSHQTTVLISCHNGLLKRINVCFEPHPMLAIFTGETPK